MKRLLLLAPLALAACAPAPAAVSSASPSEQPSAPVSTPAVEPEPSEPAPVESEAMPESSEPAPSPSTNAQGWTALDARLQTVDAVKSLALDPALEKYLIDRLHEPCGLEIVLFSVNGKYAVADEYGICKGAVKAVYGPDASGVVTELVDFTEAKPCDAYSKAGVPNGVPATDLFPEGLLCGEGTQY